MRIERRNDVGGRGPIGGRARWVGVAALLLAACAGAATSYATRVDLSPEVRRDAERPLTTAMECLERLGYEVVYHDFEIGRVWAEATGPPEAASPAVGHEIHVFREDDEVAITAEATRADGARVPVSEPVRRDVGRLASRLAASDATSAGPCAPRPEAEDAP